MKTKIFSSPVSHFIGTYLCIFILFYVLLAGLRYFVCTGAVDLMKFVGYIALAALTFLATLKLWHFDKKTLFSYFICWALYAVVLILKLFDHLTVLDREIIHTMCLCTFFVGLAFTLLYCSKIAKSRFLGFLGMLLFALCFLSPLIMIGFFVMSGGHMLSTDLIMTLFQTNLSEIRAYLTDQNLYLWSAVVVMILLSATLSLILLWGGVQKRKGFVYSFNICHLARDFVDLYLLF